ncbi:MAG TPA: acyl-CoA dehydrogenase [Zoogloea sp.]|uniref:acyl-CoA dehydrogenase n=1 Tax=Zoogloea sp. TaxID=49181 RepID=UPI002C39A93E|nr:acyl-CoA dehydrogenase [Zoogloea sp.]HMV18997.1 acyl-CoA dehydrogenase [Rhodocyclaceae bacterium]HMV64882.1 acyl-CoA dehydrogenase [Rhodocyclaceae bacterium]HMW53573.1 acyl-CoA dehydrogenase [Rhodocyclaceae bacterium]HMY51002.1 acyl-CoA dehydrogenase [Rhodocyclaceae bacterium]HMZ77522.1 acyl-CoA dehydrogenase [Rhodocyclaceae bacterium]
MSTYNAPIRDMQFVMKELAGLDEVAALPGCEEATPDLVDAILEEAGKFAGGVLAPLNRIGDTQGPRWDNGVVHTSPGWKDAYTQFAEAGWTALACEPEFGGQGLPKLVSTAVMEMWKSANMAFSLCPMLTNGAIESIKLRGTDEQKAAYLPKMVSGEWTGTMNLTEPQAGSDLAAVRTRAVPQGDGTYKIFGQKIFITYGEHDMTDNIIHLVLARLPDAPEGVKGISLFVVPKFLLNADGTPGTRNDVHCVSIEHKLGIHGSPTAVLAFGDNGGAIGTLVGEANRGLEYMFIMMNEARFAVGMEGLALSERAYQQALGYAKDRIQGTDAGVRGGPKVNILHHADVRRMLMVIKSTTEAMRALAYVVGAATDKAHYHADDAERARAQAFVDLLIPVVKGWLTENSVELTSLGVQVHGGMGFIEETGAAQHFRDARITPIYEGTTAIQANDLIGRKIAKEGGQTVKAVVAEMRQVEAQLAEQAGDEFAAIRKSLSAGITAVEEAVAYILATFGQDIKAASVGSVPFLKLLGIVTGGWQMGRAALVSARRLAEGSGDATFYKTKIVTARFYADHVLSQAPGLAYAVVNGAAGALALEEDQF